MKFNIKDRIKVLNLFRSGYHCGTITNIVFVSNECMYTVMWDHVGIGLNNYRASDVDSEWELHTILPFHSCPVIENLQQSLSAFDFIAQECDHEWEQYHGIIQSYQYCKKCDEKKYS